MLKLVMFDMDGLMLDTERLSYEAFSEVCARHGLSGRQDVYLRTIGGDDGMERRIYQESFPHLDTEAFCTEVQALCEARMRSCAAVKPGLFPLLDAIDARGGIRKAVVTSNRQAVAEALLGQTGVLARLDGGVYREMVSRCKPAPDAYLLCCRLFSVSPQEALILEDSELGLRAAQAAGASVIAIPDLLEPSAQTLSGCLARCDSLAEVIPYLDQIP